MQKLHTSQEAKVYMEHGKSDWLQIGKGVRQGSILSLYLFNLYAEYILRETGLVSTLKLESEYDFKEGRRKKKHQ